MSLPARRIVELTHLFAPGWIGLPFGHAPPEVRAVVAVPGKTSAGQREDAYAVHEFTPNEQQRYCASTMSYEVRAFQIQVVEQCDKVSPEPRMRIVSGAPVLWPWPRGSRARARGIGRRRTE